MNKYPNFNLSSQHKSLIKHHVMFNLIICDKSVEKNVDAEKFSWGSEFGMWSPSWRLRHGTFIAVAWIPINPNWEAECSSQKQMFTYNSKMVAQSPASTIPAFFPKGFTTINSISIAQDPSNWTITWACKVQFP